MSLFRLHRDERGTEMIEAALTIPIVVTLLMGMVNLGITVYAGQMAQEAARYGARVAATAQSNPAGMAYAAAASFASSSFHTGSPQVQVLAPGGVAGSTITVRVTYRVPNFMGGLVPGVPNPIVVSGEATSRQEGW